MIKWEFYDSLRPDLEPTGFGPVIDDLERHATAGHPMRNRRDPGNWAHELSHQVNSQIREGRNNGFYVLKNRCLVLPEPNFTLDKVADAVAKKDRGPSYNLYLIKMVRWWRDEPLYVMDEATAYATGLEYAVVAGHKDQSRRNSANEFVTYSRVLLETTKRLDSDYPELGVLEDYVNWNAARVSQLTNKHDGTDSYVLW
jgi:hypothetical protein